MISIIIGEHIITDRQTFADNLDSMPFAVLFNVLVLTFLLASVLDKCQSLTPFMGEERGMAVLLQSIDPVVKKHRTHEKPNRRQENTGIEGSFPLCL